MARALLFVGLVCLAFTAAGAASVETEADAAVQGRQLLTDSAPGWWGWVPTYSNAVVQGGNNVAAYTGPGNTVSQISNPQAIAQQGGYKNGASISSGNAIINYAQPDPPKPKPDEPKPGSWGRKLLTGSQPSGQWVWFNNAVVQGGNNYATNTGPDNTISQISNPQGIAQQGGYKNSAGIWSGNAIVNYAQPDPPKPKPDEPKPGAAGRKLLTGSQPSGQWVWFNNAVYQEGNNYAQWTGPGNTVSQISNPQAIAQQGGYKNYAGISSSNTIVNNAPQPKPKP